MGMKRVSLAVAIAAALAACGGGGGSPSLPVVPLVPTTPETPPAPATPTALVEIVNASGLSTTTMSTVEIGQVRVMVKDAKGVAVAGKVVRFSESGPGLLTFAPDSATALTDANGLASLEVRAGSAASAGATTVIAAVTVDGAEVTAEKSLSISSAPTVGETDPQKLASAVGFLDVNPADKSIVLAGSGGNGRAESATLRFRVVDSNNTPVKGAKVSFSVNPPDHVTLNIPAATSDSDGVVLTTVSSQNVTTAAIVVAKVDGRNISTQSDQLLVTTGVATLRGFDLSATKFNLDSSFSGDTSTITVRIVDTAGNPVSDGVPVVFTSDYLAVGTSSRGGCVTNNGACSVELSVQDPRPADGEYVTVTASTRVGAQAEAISGTIGFTANMISQMAVYTTQTGGVPHNAPLSMGVCGEDVPLTPLFAGTPAAFPAPAESTISVSSTNPKVTITVQGGGSVADQVSTPRSRTRLNLVGSVDDELCGTAGSADFDVTFTSPNGSSRSQPMRVQWPAAVPPVAPPVAP